MIVVVMEMLTELLLAMTCCEYGGGEGGAGRQDEGGKLSKMELVEKLEVN